MIQDKQRVRHRARERQIVAVLVSGSARCHTTSPSLPSSFTPRRKSSRAYWPSQAATGNAQRDRIGVARARVTKAAQQALAGVAMRLDQDVRKLVLQRQIRVRDDARDHRMLARCRATLLGDAARWLPSRPPT